MTAGAPPGFQPIQIGGSFGPHVAQMFARWHEGHFQMGFRVAEQHVNPGKACHGGMLATFADILISSAAQYQTDIPRQFLPTINLQIDFIAPAPLGCWVQGQAEILKVTPQLVFSSGLIEADGTLAARASGVFRRGPLLPDSDTDHGLRLPGMPVRFSAGG